METEMRGINTEGIISEAKVSAVKREYPDTVLSFSDVKTDDYFNMSDFHEWVEQTNARHAVSYYIPFAGNGFGIIIKKFMRKIMSFLLLPMVQQQNSFNVSVASSMNCLKKFIIDLGTIKQNEKYEMNMDKMAIMEKLDYYEEMLKKMNNETVYLQQKVKQLENQLSELGK